MLKILWNRILQSLMFSEDKASGTPDAVQNSLSSTLNAIPDLMFELDAEGRHYDFRALRSDLLVAPPEQLLGYTVSEVMPPEAAQAVMLAIKQTIISGYSNGTQILLPTPLGERWFEVSMAKKEPVVGEPPRFIALSRDITERKQEQLAIEKLAYTDPLTSLPNRLLLEKHLEMTLKSCQQARLHAAVLFMDLDNFKELNDQNGHDMGDMMLKQFADRLGSSVRSQDFVARWAGDEFVVIIEALGPDARNAEAQAQLICQQMVARLKRPYDLDGREHFCHVSIGVRLINGDSDSLEQVLKHADHAMYSAKKRGSSQYQFYLE